MQNSRVLFLSALCLRVLLVATGLWVPNEISFVGSDLVEGYESMSTDAEDYRNQAVLILGKGNAAFETAQNLLGKAAVVHMISTNAVRLAWQTHYVGDVRYCFFQPLLLFKLPLFDVQGMDPISGSCGPDVGLLWVHHGRTRDVLLPAKCEQAPLGVNALAHVWPRELLYCISIEHNLSPCQPMSQKSKNTT